MAHSGIKQNCRNKILTKDYMEPRFASSAECRHTHQPNGLLLRGTNDRRLP